MRNVIREGYTIKIKLPEKYKNYYAKCTYKYNKRLGKYSLSMWLQRNDINDDFKIDSQEIDTQYISGTRETIESNIYRVVEQMCSTGFFEKYIERFEYTYRCFDKGDAFFEKEFLNSKHND